jgi:hypothetical protein
MPYENQTADKSSHSDIVRNPEVTEFLQSCDYLKPPSDEEIELLTARFQVPPPIQDTVLPERVIAVDGSPYESSINDRLPSTKVGYIKIGVVLIDMAHFQALRVNNSEFVDPFRVAALQKQNTSLTFPLPGSNIRWKNKTSVRDSFRAVLDDHFSSTKTRFQDDDPFTSLRTTLFHLASRRAESERGKSMGTGDPTRLKLHKCPSCGQDEYPLEVQDIPEPQYCPACNEEIYPTDCLRLWEEVSDFQSNKQALTRLMLILEHLLPIHYIRFLLEQSPASLGSVAFFIDAPLAIFGNGAWLHSCIMNYLHEVNAYLSSIGQSTILVIGLQKTGQVADHVRLIERFVPPNRIFAIDDHYRYKYILAGRDEARNGFGSETYYGQDFIYKTLSGRSFVFALPYPFSAKRQTGINFVESKVELGQYLELARALSLIAHFESDLYENAVVPIALAHRYTSISLVPGGQVLDLLTRQSFNNKS